jgi:two-component system chemotaxis sensor kinase CheA
MSLYDKEMLNELIVESREHLATVEPDLLELEQVGSGVSDELINRVFRAVHSIKGGFGFFGIEKITRLSHAMENSLSRVRNKTLTVTSDLTDALFTGIDKLRLLLDDVENTDQIPIDEELAKLAPFIEETPASPGATAAAVKPTLPDNKNSSQLEFDRNIRDKHPDLTDAQIIDAVKNGRLLYQILLRSHTDLENHNLTPIDLFDEWEKIGMVLDIVLDFDTISGLSGCTESELTYSAILASVLEPDLISTATSIPSEQIYQLDTVTVRTQLQKEQRAAQGAAAAATTSATAATQKVPGKPATTVKTESRIEDALRVKVGLLNKLMNLAGELVLSRNQLLQRVNRTIRESLESDSIFSEIEHQVQQSFEQAAEAFANDHDAGRQFAQTESQRLVNLFKQTLNFKITDLSGVHAIIQNVDRVTSMLQESTMQTRLQPISVLFSKFPRIVRDLAKKCGKEVELTVIGQEVELDKSIIELLSDPLTHLIRNSVDHGIELPANRRAAGKPSSGHVILRAYHESGKVNIQIEDNGGGINTEIVKNKAIEKEMVTPEAAQLMSGAEINRFVLSPGFSTAEKVSDVSGRGVGMDVVKTNIDRLGGLIDIDSTYGTGTTITMQLPLTLAIISSLVVASEGRRFAVPQVGIEELVRVRSKDVTRLIERVGQSEVYRLRGNLLPLVRLSTILNLPPTFIHPVTGKRMPDRRARWSDRRGIPKTDDEQEPAPTPEKEPTAAEVEARERRRGGDRRKDVHNAIKIVVLHAGDNLFGLVVEEVYDSEEIVVKPLSAYIKSCGCYAGATILGDGAVTMILDTNGIARLGHLKFNDLDKAQNEEREKYDRDQSRVLQDILLFDNGSEERLGVELLRVARIEKIDCDRIEHVGNREFVRYENSTLPLIRLQHHLPIAAPDTQKSHQFIIVPKTENNPVGIAIENVHDVIRTELTFTSGSITGKNIAGSTILNKRMTIILNLPELLEEAAA